MKAAEEAKIVILSRNIPERLCLMMATISEKVLRFILIR